MTVDEVLVLVRRYYHLEPRNCCGGSLHVVLDDGNLGDADVLHCISWAETEGDPEGITLGLNLLELTEAEREELFDRYDQYAHVYP